MQLLELVLEPYPFQRDRFGLLLKIGRVELRQISRNARLQLLSPALHFRFGEVLVAIVDRLELAPSMATLAVLSKSSLRQTSINPAHTFLMAGPLSFRKSAMVLKSGASR